MMQFMKNTHKVCQ